MSKADIPAEGAIHLPIAHETLTVDKQRVVTGRVRATSIVTSREESVHEQLAVTSIRVERVPVDRLVDTMPQPRIEGNRTILSVTEEVLVRRIHVIEEIHLISEAHTESYERTVPLRRVDVEIDRVDLPESGTSTSATNPIEGFEP